MRFLSSILERVTRRWMDTHEESNVQLEASELTGFKHHFKMPQFLRHIMRIPLFFPKPKVKTPRMKTKIEDSEEKVFIENPKDKTKYSLLRRIGTGSISSCYEALRTGKGNFLVLKVVESTASSSSHQQILNEISHLRKIERHPNIIQFLDNFTDATGRICLVIEQCEHGSLADYLDRGSKLNQHLTSNIGRQILKGLQHIHRLNIVHRDLKLGNILMTSQYTIKITDFGIASPLSECQNSSTKLCGTPNYLAPEVCQRKGYSFASDVWSFGVCLFTISTGQVPFHVPVENNQMGPDEVISQTMGKIVSGRFSITNEVKSIPARCVLASILVVDRLKRPTVDQLLDTEFFACTCSSQICNDIEPCRQKGRRSHQENKLVSVIITHICKGLLGFQGEVQHLLWVKCWGQVTADTLHYVLSNDVQGILERKSEGITKKSLKLPDDTYVFEDLIECTQQLELDLKTFYSSSPTKSQNHTNPDLCAWHYCPDGSIGFLFNTGAWQVNFSDHVKLLIYRNLVIAISGNRGSHENLFNWLREDKNWKYLRPFCDISQAFSSCIASEK